MTRLEQVNEQIKRTKAKIADFQERLRGLEKQKTDLENVDILKIIHGFNVSVNDIKELIQNRDTRSGEVEDKDYSVSQTASLNSQFKKQEETE